MPYPCIADIHRRRVEGPQALAFPFVLSQRERRADGDPRTRLQLTVANHGATSESTNSGRQNGLLNLIHFLEYLSDIVPEIKIRIAN
jgi:hypothetical protein